MSSRNPNGKRNPIIEMMDEMEIDNKRKKDAENAIIESAKQDFSKRNPFGFGIILAIISAILGLLGTLLLSSL